MVTNVGDDVEKLEASSVAGQNVHRGSHFGERSAVPQRVKQGVPYDPVIPLRGTCQRDMKTRLHAKTHPQMFRGHDSRSSKKCVGGEPLSTS